MNAPSQNLPLRTEEMTENLKIADNQVEIRIHCVQNGSINFRCIAGPFYGTLLINTTTET
jgi:hypothetical protein